MTLIHYFRMRKIVEDCSEMMGETGQGFKSEDEINKEQNNNLTRTWGECWMFSKAHVELNGS